MNTTICYHSHCPDGLAAAFACWQHFGDAAQYLPVSYGQAPPDIPVSHNLFIVDFSYPAATLEALLAARIGRRQRGETLVTVLDHHASAQRDLAQLQRMDLPGLQILFDMQESGATLTWKYLAWLDDTADRVFDPADYEEAMPLFFKLVRDRDLWRWQLLHSKAISLAYRLAQKQYSASGDFRHIGGFAADLETPAKRAHIVTQGTAMEQYAAALVEEQAARAVEAVIGGYTVPLVNATTLFSEVGDYLCTTRPDIPFCAYWFLRSDGKVQVGLRARGEVDVSLVAKQYHGGGHKAASGFVLSFEAFTALLERPSVLQHQ